MMMDTSSCKTLRLRFGRFPTTIDSELIKHKRNREQN